MNIKKKFKKFSRRAKSQVTASPRSSDLDKKSFTSERQISIFFNGFRSKPQSRSSQSNSSLKSTDMPDNWQNDILEGLDTHSSVSTSVTNKEQQQYLKFKNKKNKGKSSVSVETTEDHDDDDDDEDKRSEHKDMNLTKELISNCEGVVSEEQAEIEEEDDVMGDDDRTVKYRTYEDEFKIEDSTNDNILAQSSVNNNMNTLTITKELMEIRNENMKLKEQLNNQLRDALNVKCNHNNQTSSNHVQSPFSKLPGWLFNLN